jgi:transcriptional regulator with XRE-family HTH domain
MPDAAVPVGEQLRTLRGQRGLTQEALAERSGISVDLIKKLEQGQRESARLTTLVALADALDAPLSQLLGRRPRLDGGSDRLVLGLRDAVLSPQLLPVFDDDERGEATPVDQLWQTVRRSWRLYWDGHFVELARALPGLITEARVAQRALGTVAAGPLAQAYQLTADLLVHLGREDLAALGAERGIAAAAAGDDELQWATLHGSYAWALLMQARYEGAEQVAIRIAERIEPRFCQPDRALTAARDVRREDLFTISYGRHLLDVAQAHVDQRGDDAAVEVLLEAKTLAPVWFRHQPPARSLVGQVRERKTRPSAALRDLVAALGPA